MTHPTKVKPGLEEAQIFEELWQQEIEQAPELAQVVLQRCACEQQPFFKELPGQCLTQLDVAEHDLKVVAHQEIWKGS